MGTGKGTGPRVRPRSCPPPPCAARLRRSSRVRFSFSARPRASRSDRNSPPRYARSLSRHRNRSPESRAIDPARLFSVPRLLIRSPRRFRSLSERIRRIVRARAPRRADENSSRGDRFRRRRDENRRAVRLAKRRGRRGSPRANQNRCRDERAKRRKYRRMRWEIQRRLAGARFRARGGRLRSRGDRISLRVDVQGPCAGEIC
jgi:hypothetical protein